MAETTVIDLTKKSENATSSGKNYYIHNLFKFKEGNFWADNEALIPGVVSTIVGLFFRIFFN
jgi:hypothetical protein